MEKTLGDFELLSAIFIDKNYNEKEFIMTDVFFSDEIKHVGSALVIELDKRSVGSKIMLVYADIFGNELTESFAL